MHGIRILREQRILRGMDARRKILERDLQPAPCGKRKGPSINIYESLDAFKICVSASGVSAESFDLQISEDRVVIGCQRGPDADSEDAFRRQERWHGRYRREIRLSAKIRPEEVQAESKHGVLSILLPKWQSAPLRKIAVNDGSKSNKSGGGHESAAS